MEVRRSGSKRSTPNAEEMQHLELAVIATENRSRHHEPREGSREDFSQAAVVLRG
jgi:hypothetical protein